MDEREMERLTEGFATKADKMRALERSGVARADIARFLKVRYQQVRNTLEGDKRIGYSPAITQSPNPNINIRFDAGEEAAFAPLASDADGVVRLPRELVDRIPGDPTEALYAVVARDGLFVTSLSSALTRLSRSL